MNALSAGYNPNLGGDTGNDQIEYTCVLFQGAPRSLEYTIKETSTIIPVHSKSGQPLESITISWQDEQGNNSFATNNSHWLPQDGTGVSGGDNLAGSTGILRATIIPIFNPITKDSLLNDTQTAFFYPKAGAANTVSQQSFVTSNQSTDLGQGVWVDGNCNNAKQPRFCKATITNLTARGATDKFYLRLRGIYRSSKVTITAREVAATEDAQLANAQASVDVTGKANNVLRRIQVRVPFQASYHRPEFAVESMESICKRLVSWPGGSSVDLPSGVNAGDEPACSPN